MKKLLFVGLALSCMHLSVLANDDAAENSNSDHKVTAEKCDHKKCTHCKKCAKSKKRCKCEDSSDENKQEKAS